MQTISFLNVPSDVSHTDINYINPSKESADPFLGMLEQNLSDIDNNDQPIKPNHINSENTQNQTEKYSKDTKSEIKNHIQKETKTETTEINNTELTEQKTTKKEKLNDNQSIIKSKINIDKKVTQEENKTLAVVQEILNKIQDILTKIQLPNNKLSDNKVLIHNLSELLQKLENTTNKDPKSFSKIELKTVKELIIKIQELIVSLKTSQVGSKDFESEVENLALKKTDKGKIQLTNTEEKIYFAKESKSDLKDNIKTEPTKNIQKKADIKQETEIKHTTTETVKQAEDIRPLVSNNMKVDSSEIKNFTSPIINQINELLSTLEGEVKNFKPTSSNQTLLSLETLDSHSYKFMKNFVLIIENSDKAEEISIISPKVKADKPELNLKSILNKIEAEPSGEIFLKSDKPIFNFKNEFLANFFKNDTTTGTISQEIKINVTQMERIEQIEKQVGIIKQVRSFMNLQKLNAETEVTLKLNPKSLGEIKIHITKQEQVDANNNSLILAKFQVDSETVKSIIETNLNELKDMLSENSHLSLTEFSVEVKDQGKQSFREFFKQQTTDEIFSLNPDENLETSKELLEDKYIGALNSIA